jgi:hypothetical protein
MTTTNADARFRTVGWIFLLIMILISIPYLAVSILELLFRLHLSWFTDDRGPYAKAQMPELVIRGALPYLTGWITFAGLLLRRRWALNLSLVTGLILVSISAYYFLFAMGQLAPFPDMFVGFNELSTDSFIGIFVIFAVAAAALIHSALRALPTAEESSRPTAK